MIQQKTTLSIADNSGARKIRCIKVLGGFKRKTAKLGDIIIASVQQLRYINRHKSKVLKGDIVKALIIQTKIKVRKKEGSSVRFMKNSAILLTKQGNPMGTRILSGLPKTLRKKRLLKFFSLCRGTF